MTWPKEFVPILLAGFGLGILFFGGLWITVRALPTAQHPALLALGSFWGRTAVTVAGIAWAADGTWQRAVICLAGFILARVMLSRWIPSRNWNGGGHGHHA